MNRTADNTTNPEVAIFMITYNHEDFIAEAIDSVLMQKTNFSYKLVIGEDCSKDSTRDICIEYKKKYPDKIELILNKENLGAMGNSYQVHHACNGKYVAMLEGDDFWTDPLKLQKQYDFMEANPTSSACFHRVSFNTIIENDKYLVPKNLLKNKFDIYDVLAFSSSGWEIMTSSIFYRKSSLPFVPSWYTDHKIGDITIIMMAALNGPINYIDEILGAYRENPNSLMQSKAYSNDRVTHQLINVYLAFDKHTNGKYRQQVYSGLLNYIYDLILYYKTKKKWFKYFIQTIKFNHYSIQVKALKVSKKNSPFIIFDYIRYIFNKVKTT